MLYPPFSTLWSRLYFTSSTPIPFSTFNAEALFSQLCSVGGKKQRSFSLPGVHEAYTYEFLRLTLLPYAFTISSHLYVGGCTLHSYEYAGTSSTSNQKVGSKQLMKWPNLPLKNPLNVSTFSHCTGDGVTSMPPLRAQTLSCNSSPNAKCNGGHWAVSNANIFCVFQPISLWTVSIDRRKAEKFAEIKSGTIFKDQVDKELSWKDRKQTEIGGWRNTDITERRSWVRFPVELLFSFFSSFFPIFVIFLQQPIDEWYCIVQRCSLTLAPPP